MSETKKITMLSLKNLAFMAQAIIIKAIENCEFVVKEIYEYDSIELEIQGNVIRLYYSFYRACFEQNTILDDLTQDDCLRCFIRIEKDSKAYNILKEVMVKNEQQIKIDRLEKVKSELHNLELELDLVL